MKPTAWVASLEFSDGQTISLGEHDVVVIVGPNNSGKSATLRFIRDRFRSNEIRSPVLRNVEITRKGSGTELSEWLADMVKKGAVSHSEGNFIMLGAGVHESNAWSWWHSPSLYDLARFFCYMLTADERLQAANPAEAIAVTRHPATHPIHFLYKDDSLEAQISQRFREAFGVDLIVHRAAGSQVPLYCGVRPIPANGKDRVSVEYIQELEKLPELQSQGDGMRSYAGILLYTSVGVESVLLIDEPEAFLHPPQARLLGRTLVEDAGQKRQLLIATHSGDILRGMLDASDERLRIVRLQRQGAVNIARELSASEIASYWSDPLLRYSNILDGIFHEKVILCESDGDNRFYAAVLDATYDQVEGGRRPDVMFTHCGGKDRLPTAIRALRRLGVPVVAVADFDVLRDLQPLKRIIEELGLEWAEVEPDWKLVKLSIESKKPELSAAEVSGEIETILASVSEASFPEGAKRNIQKIFRRSSPWSSAKQVGKSFVPSGDPTQAIGRLLRKLRAAGLYVVEVGELEGFYREIGDMDRHGLIKY